MATQHPDNASAPFWSDQPFISTTLEVEEIYQSFFKVGCDEYMWDWEGKFADEGMIERLLSGYHESFQKEQLGRDRFITLRVPNVWEEKTFKLARAYMSVLSAGEFMKSLGLHVPPVFELILPMTKRADQLMHLQKTFQKTAELHQSIFGETLFDPGYIHVIPLFESVDDLSGCATILEEFFALHQAHFGCLPPYLRVFIARSDPALNAGFVPSVLGTRLALRETYRVGHQYEVPVYPIIGTGSLPFRGGINPENVEKSLPQYQGARTVTIQSAFRYDYPLEEVQKACRFVHEALETVQPLTFSDEEQALLLKGIALFRGFYSKTVESMAPMINAMAAFIPGRRERVQHVGLFGYSRGVGAVRLPRAINFTGACYSMGIPPEFIGTGRGLRVAKEEGLWDLLETHFFTLRSELQHAGKFLNLENLTRYAQEHAWARDILEDVEWCGSLLGLDLGPQKESHYLHRNLTSNIFFKQAIGEDFSHDLIEAARMRKSLG